MRYRYAGRPAYRYRIRVRGRLGETIRSAFPALQAHASGGDTVLTGPLPDRPDTRPGPPAIPSSAAVVVSTADPGTALTPAGHRAGSALHRGNDADGLVRRAGRQPASTG